MQLITSIRSIPKVTQHDVVIQPEKGNSLHANVGVLFLEVFYLGVDVVFRESNCLQDREDIAQLFLDLSTQTTHSLGDGLCEFHFATQRFGDFSLRDLNELEWDTKSNCAAMLVRDGVERLLPGVSLLKLHKKICDDIMSHTDRYLTYNNEEQIVDLKRRMACKDVAYGLQYGVCSLISKLSDKRTMAFISNAQAILEAYHATVNPRSIQCPYFLDGKEVLLCMQEVDSDLVIRIEDQCAVMRETSIFELMNNLVDDIFFNSSSYGDKTSQYLNCIEQGWYGAIRVKLRIPVPIKIPPDLLNP